VSIVPIVAEPLPWLKGRDNQLARQQQLEQQLARQRALEAEKQLKLKEEQAVIKQRWVTVCLQCVYTPV